jgi:predicted GIY-YIG superfamily endonuclease
LALALAGGRKTARWWYNPLDKRERKPVVRKLKRVYKALDELHFRTIKFRVSSYGVPLKRVARRLRLGVCGVYVIRCSQSGRFKIGMTTCLASRLESHAVNRIDRTAGPMFLSRFMACKNREQALAVEALLLCYYRTARVREKFARTELFSPAPGLVEPETFTSARQVVSFMVGEFDG